MLGLADLVANGTMSKEIAETLRDAVARRRSFLVHARPRLAGKTTTTRAMLASLPPGVPVRTLGEDGDDVGTLAARARGGYLVVPEITKFPVAPGYVWGVPVREAFAAEGCALATALHADDPRTALAIVARNGVPPEHVAKLALVVHLRSLGDEAAPSARRVAGVYEVVPTPAGVGAKPLFLWDEEADRFERV